MLRHLHDLQDTINSMDYTCMYYDAALCAGSEAAVAKMPECDIPEDIRPYKL